MFILNGKNTDVGVSVFNCPNHIYSNLLMQLQPHIIFDNSANKNQRYRVYCNKGEENKTYLQDGVLIVVWKDEWFLFNSLRRSIREAIFYNLEKEGWFQVHASAINYNGFTVAFIGHKRSGKTSSALGMCKNGSEFITSDLIYINNKNNEILGWPSPIGVREETSKILQMNMGSYEETTMKWLWPSELIAKNYILGIGKKLNIIINPYFDFGAKNITLEKFNDSKKFTFIKENIHNDEIHKSNLWNIERKTIEEYEQEAIKANWYQNIPFIRVVSNGLNEEYISTIKQIIDTEVVKKIKL